MAQNLGLSFRMKLLLMVCHDSLSQGLAHRKLTRNQAAILSLVSVRTASLPEVRPHRPRVGLHRIYSWHWLRHEVILRHRRRLHKNGILI